MGSQEGREAWNRRGSSMRQDGLLGQGGVGGMCGKERDRWENRSGVQENAKAGRGWMSTVGLMPEPTPYSSFGGSCSCSLRV